MRLVAWLNLFAAILCAICLILELTVWHEIWLVAVLAFLLGANLMSIPAQILAQEIRLHLS